MKRHLLHHQFTFDERDPKLSRKDLTARDAQSRWRALLPWVAAYNFKQRSIRYMAGKYAGLVKPDKSWLMFDRFSTVAYFGLMAWYAGFGRVIAFLALCILGSAGLFNQGRTLLEHGTQDMSNPLSQGTFYETGLLLKLAYFGVPQGDGHIVHHIFPPMPCYNILLHATPAV